ncbi:MAG: peptide-methionine (R)-S-oxide reductase MsrB [Erysipelotrichaceae bacterium]
MKKIYLAGGCYWGCEHFFKQVYGITETSVGFANGTKENPTYEEACTGKYGFVETVAIDYDETLIDLYFILELFFKIINPTTLNKQKEDEGIQYRTGIYYVDPTDESIINRFIHHQQRFYTQPIVTEVMPLQNYYKAHEAHQAYLEKNSSGYCHVDFRWFNYAKIVNQKIDSNLEGVKEKLTPLQYEVTQNKATEPSFNNEYCEHFKDGIYVDIVSNEPLFSSKDKYDSGCGWPSFAKPLLDSKLEYLEDHSLGIKRIEVVSKNAKTHLGHVFNDGAMHLGGLRYCVNSASLKFIPKEKMEEEGFGYLINLL